MSVESILESSQALTAAHHPIGVLCREQSKAFLRCKVDSRNPADCIPQGVEVTNCALDALRQIRKNCEESFNKYADCLDKRGMKFHRCRQTQKVFDECTAKFLPPHDPPNFKVGRRRPPLNPDPEKQPQLLK